MKAPLECAGLTALLNYPEQRHPANAFKRGGKPPHSKFFPSSRAGFSLLEVLVALVVFAIGVTGMLTALGYQLRDISLTEDHAHAVRLASREMNALRRNTYLPTDSTTGSSGRFQWTTMADPLNLSDFPGMDSDDDSQTDALTPCELTVTVSWSDNENGSPTHKVKLTGIELFEES